MLLPPMLVERLPRIPPGEDVTYPLWRRGEDGGAWHALRFCRKFSFESIWGMIFL